MLCYIDINCQLHSKVVKVYFVVEQDFHIEHKRKHLGRNNEARMEAAKIALP